MYPRRRSDRRRRSNTDRDWEVPDPYLDWVPDDREYIPKFKFPVVPLVALGLLGVLLVAAQFSLTTVMHSALVNLYLLHGQPPHHTRPPPVLIPIALPKAPPSPPS